MGKKNQPLLTICIPTYNRAENLRNTLTHLANTLDHSFEIVVSNNCSIDHTIDILKDFANKWENFRYINQPEKVIKVKNTTAALRMAKGKYLYCLSDDNRLIEDGISKAIKIMEKHPGVIGVFGGVKDWDPENDKVLSETRLVEKNVAFRKGSKKEILQQFPSLYFPVILTEICQRFAVNIYDRHSWGGWPFVSKMLDRGDVVVIPEFLYKHAHTKSRIESCVTQGWYHDMKRTEYELYIGELGHGNLDNCRFVNTRTNPLYLEAVKFAAAENDWLTVRAFLLRARAHNLISDEKLYEWEKSHLISIIADRIIKLTSLGTNINRILFEKHNAVNEICETLQKKLTEVEVEILDYNNFLEHDLKPDDFIIAWDYETLSKRQSSLEEDCLRQCSLKDIIASSRLTQIPVNFV